MSYLDFSEYDRLDEANSNAWATLEAHAAKNPGPWIKAVSALVKLLLKKGESVESIADIIKDSGLKATDVEKVASLKANVIAEEVALASAALWAGGSMLVAFYLLLKHTAGVFGEEGKRFPINKWLATVIAPLGLAAVVADIANLFKTMR